MKYVAFKDHFSETPGYAAYRPTYPAALVSYLASISPSASCALDCGCGTGQLSVLLADKFHQVIATDASEAQIHNAQARPGVAYRVAKAEQSGLPPASVDLITVAQAAHWLDLEKFYEEVRRVARPTAVVALITYGILDIEGGVEKVDSVDKVVKHFYSDVIGPYWPPERRLVEEGYRTLPFPFEELAAPALAIEASWRLQDLVGFVDTWSAVRAAEKKVGRAPFEQFRSQVTEAWGHPETRRAVRWPLALRVGRVRA